ncbi:hypothetical protein Tco_0356996 [Tanacetum coccineum]
MLLMLDDSSTQTSVRGTRDEENNDYGGRFMRFQQNVPMAFLVTKNMINGKMESDALDMPKGFTLITKDKIVNSGEMRVLKKHSKWDAADHFDSEDHTEIFGPDARPRPPGKTRPAKKTKSETAKQREQAGSVRGSMEGRFKRGIMHKTQACVVVVEYAVDLLAGYSTVVDVFGAYLLGGAIDGSELRMEYCAIPSEIREFSFLVLSFVTLSYESVDVIVRREWLLRNIRVDGRSYLLSGAIDGSEVNEIIQNPKWELESSCFTFDLVPLVVRSVCIAWMIVESLKDEKMYVKFSNNVKAEHRGSYLDVEGIKWVMSRSWHCRKEQKSS